MEPLKLVLDTEQAQFLNKRASELRSTPDELVLSLVRFWVHHAGGYEPLGEGESVQDRMALIADHYADESRELLEDDPDLCLDVTDQTEFAGATFRAQDLPRGTDDEEPHSEMSEADVEQAFAEIAEHYEQISREVFGEEPALSVDALPDRNLIACRFTVLEEPQRTNWASALLERILAVWRWKRPTEVDYPILHLRLPAGEQIDRPTILYVEPDPARSRLFTAADQ